MTALAARLVALVLRLYPASFRERFGAEMLATYLDQSDRLIEASDRPVLVAARHAAWTIAGLLRSVIPVHLDERRRLASLAIHSPQTNRNMSMLATHTRHAIRALRLNPGFSAVAIITLALGIGANSAVFSVLNSVILAPLPYRDPERLVRIYTTTRTSPTTGDFTAGLDLVDLRERTTAFSAVGGLYLYREVGGDLAGRDGVPQRVRLLPVSAEYFATLGVTPLLGRTFTRDEERTDARLMILSHDLWKSFAASDSAVIGRRIDVNGEAHEVIGVMRPTFTDVVAGDAGGWIPLDLQRSRAPGAPRPVSGGMDRANRAMSVIARLQPGVSLGQAQSQVDAFMRRLAEEFPDSNHERFMRVVPLHGDVVGESSRAVYVLMGAAGLVLLIACLNVANLFLVRNVARSRETAIRAALGATPRRLVEQRLTESVMVALLGGAVGSAVAYWGVKVLLAVSPESLARAEEVRFDPRLLAFATLLTVVTGLLFGVGPALRARRVDPIDAMRDGSRGNTGGRASRQARDTLVTAQVSLALVLLVGAGILMRSFSARQRVALGLESANVATFEVHLPAARYDSANQRIQFHTAFRERLRSVPGVQSVGATSWLPTNGRYHPWGYRFMDDAGQRQQAPAQIRIIDGAFFSALAIPLLGGRVFSSSDRLDTNYVAVISRSLAKRVYGDRDPIGQRFGIIASRQEITVIGVVGDVANEVNAPTYETVYLSHDQFASNRNWSMTYVVKATVPVEHLVAAARRELSRVDPALVVYQPRPMDSVLARHNARHRFTMLLMGTFAGVALCLAAVGLYGVLAYTVTQRTHEIGVRMALGAPPSRVHAIVMRQGLLVAGVGAMIGLAGALATSGLLQSLVFGVSARDPVVYAVVAFVFGAVAVVAGYAPARRATRVDPVVALRAPD